MLPILVPASHELQAPGNQHGFKNWEVAPKVATGKWPAAAPLRPEPLSSAQVAQAARSALVQQWRERLGWRLLWEWPRPSTSWAGAEEEGLPGDLTEHCVLALRILLNRQRPNPGGVHRRTLGRIAKTFVLNTATAVAGNADRPVLACLLASMYWHGCRHPAALRCAALHPATGLVRWLSSFTAVQQVEHPRQIQRLLYAEVLRIHCLSEAIVAAMIQESRGDDLPVALLPELLRFQELPKVASNHIISTVTHAKSMTYR